MTAPAQPPAPPRDAAPAARQTERSPLRLVLVPPPPPPLTAEARPARLVLPGVPVPRPPHRPGPRPEASTWGSLPDPDFGPTWTTRAELPPAADAGRVLLTLAVEALSGRRPVSQLRSSTSLGVFTALSRGRRPRWCTEGGAPLVWGPVHVCEPVDGVAEVSAVVRRSGRAHAVAARLEGIDGRWRCTALQIG